jgi:hypothetical protein
MQLHIKKVLRVYKKLPSMATSKGRPGNPSMPEVAQDSSVTLSAARASAHLPYVSKTKNEKIKQLK